jgi:hypothetical protein
MAIDCRSESPLALILIAPLMLASCGGTATVSKATPTPTSPVPLSVRRASP